MPFPYNIILGRDTALPSPHFRHDRGHGNAVSLPLIG
jgi:hypothetical protein